MTEQTLIRALAAVSDKISRLKSCKVDAERYASDPKTLDKEFWIDHAKSMQSRIDEYESAHKELLHQQTDDN